MTMGSGKSAGSALKIVLTAFGPPVDEPIASRSMREGRLRRGTVAAAVFIGRDGSGGRHAMPSDLILGINCAFTFSMPAVTLPTLAGLVT